MTEKEAIKNLKEIIDLSKEEIENNDENITVILDLEDLKSLAIILNLLEQTQTKKSLKGIINKQNKEISKLKADLYECNNIISDYIDTVKEKDKIIDLIIEFIWIHDFCRCFPENRIKCKMKGFELKLENCKNKCIKQYFEKKAREENDI